MRVGSTQRGFKVGDFHDSKGNACSIQESSQVADEEVGAFIWLGCNEIGLRRFEPGKGWSEVHLENETIPSGVSHVANNRMHLSQRDVTELLPVLQHFAEHGELPST